jgi:two-component system sensor histidine kinase RegB
MKATHASRRGFFQRARGLTEILAWLRLCAVAGQALTVAVVAVAFHMPVAVAPLALGIAVLTAFALFAFWRLRQPWPVGMREAFVHVAVDIGALTFLLYWSGGVTNPFASLLIMPIALAAAALPLRYVAAVAVLAAACYLALIPWHIALPALPPDAGAFNLHVAGMTINFVLTAVALAFFIARLARALRDREAEVQHERERTLRDEGILAIAAQAAGTAHELNTPLSTIRTLLGELRREQPADSALGADLALLAGQAERCRDILRELVAVGNRQLAGTPQRLTLAAFVGDCENQFRLLRPEVTLQTSVDAAVGARIIEAAPDLRHALINLLSNAADASLAAGSTRVELDVSIRAGQAEFGVRDRGSGIATGAGLAFRTDKRDGLGLGLALAHATAERLGGELTAQMPTDGGLLQRLRVPLATTDNRNP